MVFPTPLQSKEFDMKAISYGLSIKGNGHYITDTECQDSVKYAGGTINEKEYSIVAVADGHGGSQYARSKVGSQFAVDIAVRELEAFIKNNIDTLDKYDESAKGTKSLALLSPFSIIGKSESSTPPDLLSEIQVSLEKTKDKILSAWSNAVLSHFADNPIEVVFGTISKYNSISNECDKEVFVGYGEELEQELKLINNDLQSSILDDLKNNPKSLYGSTLLCAAKYQKHHFIIQIGDGDIEIVLSDKMIDVFVDRFGRDIRFSKTGDQKYPYRTTVEVCMSDKFLAWIIALGDEVKIIEPDSVVEQMRSNLIELLKLYDEKGYA